MEKEFFSEIIDFLKKEGSQNGSFSIPDDIRKDFFGNVKKSAVPAAAVKNTEHSAGKKPLPAAIPEGWEELAAAVRNCSACPLAANRKNTVFGEGNVNAELMFIGEGPGADEDASGRPFVGEAGQLLTKMIAAMGYSREDVYIANIVKCRPPGNRNPNDTEADACIGYLHRQIQMIKPQVIVLLGSVPLRYLMGLEGITKIRGRWLDFNSIPVMPTFHPAFLLRDPSRKRPVWEDLQEVMRKLGKPLPERKK